MRFLTRSVDFKDREDLLALSRHFPLCSLPASPSKLDKKIKISQESFKHILPQKDRNYLFVLEDLEKKKIIGSSQIMSYFAEKKSLCYFLEKSYLKLGWIKTGRNQIGGLILHPDYRKSKALLGLQIGLARFLYIKNFPKEFSSTIEVSLTAPIKNNKNHFWEETGLKHLKINYLSALQKFQKDRIQFFSLFQKNLKINLDQLSPQAKAYMDQVHPQTVPVYKGLLKRGFHKTNHYHVIDGGIYLEALWKNLSFLKKAKFGLLQKESEIKNAPLLLSQQTKNGFFCALLKGQIKGKEILLREIPLEFEKEKKALALPFPS